MVYCRTLPDLTFPVTESDLGTRLPSDLMQSNVLVKLRTIAVLLVVVVVIVLRRHTSDKFLKQNQAIFLALLISQVSCF